ncbi:PGF-CTERM sorting domain-containing protein [Haladaptatus sp. R4]|uniref:DUF7827 domain-containing protein n=1 Tax=Haladaptatus sp. R4 TaxID=1679489 RepID=UPI0007B49815|nr:PGF-CTERM sorting domain-containing protein [Haladaptatus sp. R4]KZN24444.1 PGF-CTERM sorting domain-containing protein [Haladaptatus sp. R4]
MNLRNALTALVLVSLLASGSVIGPAAATTAGNAMSADNPAVQSPDLFENDANSTVTFNRSMYEVQKGETVTMSFDLKDADAITVQIGGGAKAYKLNATVTDGNGDGTVVLIFDTSKAGSGDGSALTVNGDDGLTVKNETKSEFSPDMYGLTVYAGTGKNVPKIGYGGLEVKGDSTTTRETTSGSDSETTTTNHERTTTTTANDSSTTTTSDSGGQPGFGLGVSVVALAAVALLARRQ